MLHMVKTNGIKLNTTEMFQRIQNIGPNETHLLASITTPEADIVLPVYKDRPFLRKFNVHKTGTHEVRLGRHGLIGSSVPIYSGIQFLPDNGFLLTDSYYGCCCFVTEDCVVSNQLNVYGGPLNPYDYFSNERHATYFGNNVIGVSIPSRKTIFWAVCDPRDGEKVSMKCEYIPKALCALNNGDLAVTWDKPVAFGIISCQLWKNDGKVFRDVDGSGQSYCEKVYFNKDKTGRQFKSFGYMAVDEDRLHVIQSCSVDKAVYSFDFEGSPVFCYNNEALKEPRGVALDGEGNIYICDYSLGAVHVVSAEGMDITIIKEGCPSMPLAIGYNKSRNVFAVTVYDAGHCGTIHFFSVASK